MCLDLKNYEQKFCHIKQKFLEGIYTPEFRHGIGVISTEFWPGWFPLVINFPFDTVWSSTVIKSWKELIECGHCHW